MAKYIANEPIKHDGENYAPGDPIELKPEQATRLGDKVKPAPADKKEPTK